MSTEVVGDTDIAVADESNRIQEMSDKIGEQLFGSAKASDEVEEVVPSASAPPAAAAPAPSAPPPQPVESTVPKSWPKDMHAYWDRTPKEVQQYWGTREKQMLDGLDQYKRHAEYGQSLSRSLAPLLRDIRAQGISESDAVARLVHAQQSLTRGTEAQRIAAYEELGRNLGLTQKQVAAATTAASTMSPEVQALQTKLSRIENAMLSEYQARQAQVKTTASKEVESFASDTTAHPHFDEVSDDIVRFIQQGFELGEAYEKAVWANPVTRAKEIARVQTDHEAKLKENARLDALPKKRAAAVNVKGKETGSVPTEPTGSLEDTLRQTIRQIREHNVT